MKTMMFLGLLLLSTVSWAQECKSKNHIFLLHGIGGDITTFGSLPQYLNQQKLCYSAVNFLYDTGNSDLTTYDFANAFDSFVQETLKTNKVSEDDKVSLIMHSQGGIVGSLWLNKVRLENQELYKKIDSFITLSTPYWGAGIANKTNHIFYTLPENVDNPISPFGRKELEEMTYGSKTIKNLWKNYFDIFGKETHLRALAIGGIKRNHSPYIGEDDLAVSAHSSRPDHFYYSGNLSLKDKNEILPISFAKTNFIPYIAVRATHSKLDLPGVADIPAKCLTAKKCKHPSIDYIMDHLAGKKVSSKNEKFPFRKYRVHIYIEDLHKFGLTHDDVEVEYNGKLFGREKDDELSGNGQDGTFSFTGISKSIFEDVITINLTAKGKNLSTIKARVQGGYMTFIQLKVTE